MINLVEEAKKMQDFCDGQNWRFCFIGGLALQKFSLNSKPYAVNIQNKSSELFSFPQSRYIR